MIKLLALRTNFLYMAKVIQKNFLNKSSTINFTYCPLNNFIDFLNLLCDN